MKKIILPLILICLLFSSCSLRIEEPVSKTVFAMDTVMTISACGEDAEIALKEAEKEIFRLDKLLRRKDENSEVYKINQGTSEVSAETSQVIKEALEICKKTDGAFDISIASLMDLWGFYEKKYRVPSEEELVEKLSETGYENITVDGNTVAVSNGAQIDLGGIAKGYLSDKIKEIFGKYNIDYGLISLGGNVVTYGKKPTGDKWKVAIQDPDDESSYSGVLSVEEKAVVTSGGYQRFFEENGVKYHHILDPKTGCPAKSGVKSVTIVCDSGTSADGLSTAMFVMGVEKGAEYWRENGGFEAVFITENDEIFITKGLKGSFESENGFKVIE